MSVSAKIHVNGAGRPNRDDTFRLRAAELDKPAILSAMSEKNVFTTAPGKENVPTGADGSTSERYASSNLPNKRGRPCGMNKDGKPLWMLTNPKEERGTVVNMFWKQITEVNRECGLEALQALLGVLPTGASDPTIDSIVATITDPVFASIDTEALDRGASRSERVSGITG